MFMDKLRDTVRRYKNGSLSAEEAGGELLKIHIWLPRHLLTCDAMAAYHMTNSLYMINCPDEEMRCDISSIDKAADILEGRENAYFYSMCGINWTVVDMDKNTIDGQFCDKRSEITRLRTLMEKIDADTDPDDDEIKFMNDLCFIDTGAPDNAVNIILAKIIELWRELMGYNEFHCGSIIYPVGGISVSNIRQRLIDGYIKCYLGECEFLAEIFFKSGTPQVSFTAVMI